MSKNKTPETISRNELPRHISRAVLRVPDFHPSTKELSGYEVAVTTRPGWSKISRYERELPGGKIEIEAGDFEGILSAAALVDPNLVISLEQMIAAGLKAAKREVYEELGLYLAAGLLSFVDVTTNRAGWTTYAYAAELAKKPKLAVMSDSAGSGWLPEDQILYRNPKLLPGHLNMARRALIKLDKKNQSTED